MDTNNVVNITDTSNINDVVNVSSNTVAIAETAPLTLTTHTNSLGSVNPFYSFSTNYTTDLQIKRAQNGYVVTYQYSTYVAKNEKELNKLVIQLLNPNKGKKNNGKKA